jgi:hypothetical protein
LKSLLKAFPPNLIDILDYLKSLSPSGLELEFLSLSTFDLDSKSLSGEPLNFVSLMLSYFLELTLRK